MRSIYYLSFLALNFAAICGAQIVLDPVPARVAGHQAASPAEQLVVNTLNPNFALSGGLYSPAGIAVDTTGSTPTLYVADTGNNRILAWKNATSSTLPATLLTCSASNAQNPCIVIGQPNPDSTLPGINGGLHYPSGLLVDSKGNLYVADSGNNRVLRFPAPVTSTSTPDIVIGQPDPFTSNKGNQGTAPSAQTVCFYVGCPFGTGPFLSAMAMDSSGNLFVVDAGNSRVLRYSAALLTSGAYPAADLVVGQANFTAHLGPNGVYDKNTLYVPAGIGFDTGGRLFVSDLLSRVVVFPAQVSSAAAGNGIAAIRFAGIVSPAPPTATSSTLSSPDGILMIGGAPAVMDAGDNRMLFFDSYTSADWTLASGDTTLANPPPSALKVIGQGTNLTNFTSVAVNAGNIQAAFPNNGVATFDGAVAAASGINGDLFVADTGNNRVLVYQTNGQTGAPVSLIGQSGYLYNSPNSIHGAEFYFGAANSSYDSGIAVDSSSGTPHLYVSDPGNNRVLGFRDARNAGPGVPADLVIGQPDMLTGLCNYGGFQPTSASGTLQRQPTNSSLCSPIGLAVDPGTGDLFVADNANGRVLRFPAPFASGAASLEAADLVLGQAAFTGPSNPKAGQSIMIAPYGLFFDPHRGLLVSDDAANRVLIFPMTSPTNGEAASAVIGQPDFVSTDTTVLNSPHHVAEDTIAEVYVADSGHNQILVFTATSTATTTPVNSYGGLYYPQAVWVNQSTIAGYQNDIWVGDFGYGISRFPVPNPLVTGGTPTLTMPAAEVTGPSVTCSAKVCGYAAVAMTQDSFGTLYVADASNRVAIHYPALAGENTASSVCIMGCSLGGLAEQPFYLAPGAFGSLYLFNGLSFASTVTTNYDLPVPTSLGGLQVTVNGVASPIAAVLPSQINFVVPWEAPSAGTAQVEVVNASTTQVVASGTMNMNAAAPGFFTTNAAGTGQIAALNCNQTPCENTVNGPSNPVNPGKYIQFFLTGQGLADLSPGPPGDGQLPSGTVNTAKPAVYIGASLATVEFSGLAPCCVGLWQINVQIPGNFSLEPFGNFKTGIYPVLVDYNGLASNTPQNNSNPNMATTIYVNGL